MPFPVQFFLAFVIVLGLIGATAWAVRRFGLARLAARICEAVNRGSPCWNTRWWKAAAGFILVRRDNVEHLLLIGGPTDIVVEPNIVRATAARVTRRSPRPPASDALPRAIPLPDTPGNGSWPLQPEPMAPVGAPRPVRIDHDEQPAWPLQPQTDSRTQRDALAALADEVSPRSGAPRNRAQGNARSVRDRVQPSYLPRRSRRLRTPTRASPKWRIVLKQRCANRTQEPSSARHRPCRAPWCPTSRLRPRKSRRLSCRRRRRWLHRRRAGRGSRAKPPRAEGKQANGSSGKTLYDNLEQEMASLLGRPAGKT